LASIRDPKIEMGYEEIEKVLGRRLPETAYGKLWRQFWANTETHSQGKAWLRAGWRVSRPDLANKVVEFSRTDISSSSDGTQSITQKDTPHRPPATPSASNANARKSIVVPQEHLDPSTLRMVEDAAEELGGDLGLAMAELLNRAAMARRRQLLEWFAENAPRSGTSSVKLIREDRDAR
jgi:hypothetical protein